MKISIVLIIFLLLFTPLAAQNDVTIEIGTFNIRFFPCNQDAAMMQKYNIELRYPPQGVATDTTWLFNILKMHDIELLGVQEIVDPPLFREMAKRHLGQNFEFVYAPSQGWQKVGFLYNSDKLQLIGSPVIHSEVTIGKIDRLRPALRAYFKTVPDGYDFYAIVVHLKAAPSGYNQRVEQWRQLEKIMDELPRMERHDSDVILLGDFNNTSENGFNEFLPILHRYNYFWYGMEGSTLLSNYWRPDWTQPEIHGSTIDQIFISDDSKIEYIEGSTRAGGMCAQGQKIISGDFPDYYLKISDHCPVYASFRAFPDDD
jgi:endonuclease/exonuclease/phosphatase family metal-dependent hydrolase